MAWDINRVVLVGRLTRDVEFRYTPNQTALAKFSIAVGGRPNPDGSENTSFFDIVAWGKTAEVCNTYLSRGKQVAIDGHLQQQKWQAQDGSKRNRIEVVAEKVEFLGEKQGAPSQNAEKPSWNAPSGNVGSGRYSNQTPSPSDEIMDETEFNSNPISGDDFVENDDDMPF